MNTNTTNRVLRGDDVANRLVTFIGENENELGLSDAELYYDFPILKDLDDEVIISQILIVSREHGVVAISTSSCATVAACADHFADLDVKLENLSSLVFSRLLRNKFLRKTPRELAFPTLVAIFAPLVAPDDSFQYETQIIFSNPQLQAWLNENRIPALSEVLYQELVSTIDGAKGLIRPKQRELAEADDESKGFLANLVESEIASFDVRQKHGSIPVVDGIQRVRGLAGSGKTVVLAMKAALLHLRNPESTILYTFWTKSLYQQVRRLITRFYRQFDDKDPDWSRIKVMHAWGGYGSEGVLFNACIAHSVPPLNYSEAVKKDSAHPFEYSCTYLLRSTKIVPQYDYVFVDEGQDFAPPFYRLCLRLARENRLVFAYDELQNIFQATTPTMEELLGGGLREEIADVEDIILYKCYRNPREIIVSAHALGFGLYSDNIVQMLENKDQWEDVGYKVLEGEFVEGSPTVIERPPENSLTTLSNSQSPDELVQSRVCESFEEEIDYVVNSVQSDIEDKLRPDDILIIVVDDKNFSSYADAVIERLVAVGINCNNMNTDRYGIRDFQQEGFVTISTVHKAKGNEAYMVYVVGVDALFNSLARVRSRNRLFTAMTRAKGWVRVSGVGVGAERCQRELNSALEKFPNLEFTYPSEEQLNVIKRDLAEKDSVRIKAERKLDEVLGQMSVEEVQEYVNNIAKRPSK